MIRGYWSSRLDCGCEVSLDAGEYGGVVVEGGRITRACAMHAIGENLAAVANAREEQDDERT